MKQVVCINWGPKYGAPYINRLYGMVARNITPPFRFVAFTDVRKGVRPEVECHDLPEMPGFVPTRTPGQWQKSRLWAPALADLSGPYLFVDLDVVITGSLDPFFDYGDPDDIVMGLNVAKLPLRRGQSSVYRAPVGKLAPLQAAFAKDPQGIADEYRFEQFFMAANAPGGVRFWPRAWMRHFRLECIPTLPLNFFRPPRLPKDARIVIFAGGPNPPEAITGQRREGDSHLSPAAFVRDTFRRGKGLKELQNYGLPAPWVSDYWRE